MGGRRLHQLSAGEAKLQASSFKKYWEKCWPQMSSTLGQFHGALSAQRSAQRSQLQWPLSGANPQDKHLRSGPNSLQLNRAQFNWRPQFSGRVRCGPLLRATRAVVWPVKTKGLESRSSSVIIGHFRRQYRTAGESRVYSVDRRQSWAPKGRGQRLF